MNRKHNWLKVAAASLSVLLAAFAAEAQNVDPAQQGNATCIARARPVPGLAGLPVWPALEGRRLNTIPPVPVGTWTPPSDTLAERGDVADPRWGNAPLTGLPYVSGPSGANLSTQNVRFRVLVDPSDRSKLAVSIQVTADDNGPTATDYVMFGFASYDGTNAWGVRIEPRKSGITPPASFVKLPNSALRDFNYTGGAWSPPAGSSGVMPTWIERDATGMAGTELISYWNSSTPEELDTNGARWTVQFRVKLPSGVAGGAGTPDADRARFFIGVHVDQDIGASDYASGNIFTGCGANCNLTPANTSRLAAFPAAPAQWTTLASLTGACTGVGIRGEQIRSTGSVGPNAVNVGASVENRFEVRPDFVGTVRADTVAADLFIANWGTVSSATAGWNRLPNQNVAVGAPTVNDATGLLSFRCTNAAGAPNICSRVSEANIRSADHQCLQVQLRQASTTTPVQFSNATDYTNMFYQGLSETSQVAEISVKGLQQLLGNSRTRDVYLHVVTHNLPLPSATAQTLDVPALEALRAQVDPSFPNQALTCDQSPADRCLPGPNGAGVCRRLASGSSEGYFCTSEAAPFLYEGRYYCPLSVSESCTVPAGGGYNPDKSALTPGQKIRAEFPTIEIFPYYDTGASVTVNGVTRRRLVPMPSFGMYFTHSGAFYGFLRSMVEEYNTLFGGTAQRVLQQIGTDTYRISVANESVTGLRVTVSTQDAQPNTFFQVVGTATPLGFTLGNATFTGLARTRALDLSRSTVVMQKLLYTNGRELVANLRGPVTLTRNAGSSSSYATFTKSGTPTITMQVRTLPFIGQTITIQVTGASVDVPPTCPLLIGSSNLTTAFTISDGLGAPAAVEGSDTWTCFPGQLVSF